MCKKFIQGILGGGAEDQAPTPAAPPTVARTEKAAVKETVIATDQLITAGKPVVSLKPRRKGVPGLSI